MVEVSCDGPTRSIDQCAQFVLRGGLDRCNRGQGRSGTGRGERMCGRRAAQSNVKLPPLSHTGTDSRTHASKRVQSIIETIRINTRQARNQSTR